MTHGICNVCRYIFSTEGHILPASPQISLASEHCSYLGSYCRAGQQQGYGTADISLDQRETNDTEHISWDRSIPHPKMHDSFSTSGFIKVYVLTFISY